MSMSSRSRGLIAFTVMLPTLIEIIDTSIVNVSLDHIRGSLSAGYDEATWTITAYLVSNAIVIPMAGWLAKLIGRKNYQIASIALFTFSSFMCGSAWSLNSLIFFRVLQGIGGGGLVPISQSILLEAFPREKHGQAMAIFGMGAMMGPIVGPLLGGWITDTLLLALDLLYQHPDRHHRDHHERHRDQGPALHAAPEDEDRLLGAPVPCRRARRAPVHARQGRERGLVLLRHDRGLRHHSGRIPHASGDQRVLFRDPHRQPEAVQGPDVHERFRW